MKTEHMFR